MIFIGGIALSKFSFGAEQIAEVFS